MGADADAIHGGLLRTSLGLTLLAVLPMVLGLVVRAAAPQWTRRHEGHALRLAGVAFLAGLAVSIAAVWDEIPRSARQAGPAAVLLNLAAVAAGYAIATVARLTPSQRVVLILGSTTRQFAVASFVALTLCRDPRLLVPAIPYCLVMWVPALGSALLARSRSTAAPAGALADA